MRGGEFPPLRHPHTLARLAAPDDVLFSFLPGFLAAVPRLNDPAQPLEQRIEQALGYPWGRVEQPAIVLGGELLPDAPLEDRAARHRVLAIGANGSPQRLAFKFAGIDDGPVRALPGELEDFDVCASPVPTAYGSFAGELVASPGTRVRVTALELTEPQIEHLTLTEFGYRFGRLDEIRLRTADGAEHDAIHAYVPRIGVYAINGAPVPLAAVPASGRARPALTQEQLLDDCAQRLLGPGAGARELLGALLTDWPAFVDRQYPLLLAAAVRPELPGFTPHPLGAVSSD